MSTNGFTTAERNSVFCGIAGSSVMRSAVFEIGPEKFFVSTVSVIFPSPPGLMTLSNSGTVHPQDGLTSVMWRSALPVFLTTNTCLIGSPFATCPTSFLSSGMTSRGPEASAVFAWAASGDGRSASASADAANAETSRDWRWKIMSGGLLRERGRPRRPPENSITGPTEYTSRAARMARAARQRGAV